MHWRKGCLWLVLEGVLLGNAISARYYINSAAAHFVPDPAITDCRQQPWGCSVKTSTLVLLSIQVACILIYAAAYIFCGT